MGRVCIATSISLTAKNSTGAGDERVLREIFEIAVDQFDAMAGVEQRAADHQQPERGQMVVRHARADGGVGDVENEDVQERAAVAVSGVG